MEFVICTCGKIVRDTIFEKHCKTDMHRKLKKRNRNIMHYLSNQSKKYNKELEQKFDYLLDDEESSVEDN